MNQNRQAPIGVFDSGVGGLTVAREIMRNLPSERIVYFGDTARVPYGSKSKEIVLKFSRQIVRFFTASGCKDNRSGMQYSKCTGIRRDKKRN